MIATKKSDSDFSTGMVLPSLLLALLVSQLASASPIAPIEEPSVGGQGSRNDELLEKRRQRLASVQPAKAGTAATTLASLENKGFDQFFTVQWKHWRVGLGKISPLSSLTPGVGYERPRLGGSPLNFRVQGAYSLKGYQTYSMQFGLAEKTAPYDLLGAAYLGAPFDFDQRQTAPLDKFVYTELRYKNFPREEFFGVGPDSKEDNRSDYRLEEGLVDVVAGYQPARWLALEARAGYMPTHIGRGTNDRLPDVHDMFDGETAPGLENTPDFMHFDGGLFLSWLGDPFKPAAQLGLQLVRFKDLNSGLFTFTRVSMDARGYLTLGCRQRVIAVRGFMARDFGNSGSQTPFYLMKTLGGEETLRGFRNGRFRDENQVYLSSEYRWEATPGFELAVFYDTGKVFPDRSGFSFDNLQHSYGAGIRGKGERWPFLRLDIGRGAEGTFLYVTFGPAF